MISTPPNQTGRFPEPSMSSWPINPNLSSRFRISTDPLSSAKSDCSPRGVIEPQLVLRRNVCPRGGISTIVEAFYLPKIPGARKTNPHRHTAASPTWHILRLRNFAAILSSQAPFRPRSTPANPNRSIEMKRFATLCAILAITLTLTACNQTADTHDADVKAIQDNEAQWNQDWAAKDQDKIMAHYSDDAILIVSGSPSNSGKEAIRTALKPMVADPALSLKFHANKVEVAKSGDVAYTQG